MTQRAQKLLELGVLALAGFVAVLLVLWLVGARGAEAAPFDGVGGDELPPSPACWAVCPPAGRWTQAAVFTRVEPFQCVTTCRHRPADPFPPLPGGPGAWEPQAVPAPCPRGQGQATSLVVRGPHDYAEDAGCYVP